MTKKKLKIEGLTSIEYTSNWFPYFSIEVVRICNTIAIMFGIFKDKITTSGENKIGLFGKKEPFVRVTVPQSLADYELGIIQEQEKPVNLEKPFTLQEKPKDIELEIPFISNSFSMSRHTEEQI